MDHDTICFLSEHGVANRPIVAKPVIDAREILLGNEVPFLHHRTLDPSVVAEMAEEFEGVRDLMLDHAGAAQGHEWFSLNIYGIDERWTRPHMFHPLYRDTPIDEVPFRLTKWGERCPRTVQHLHTFFPMEKYYRVRFMLLKGKGYLPPHVDIDHYNLSPINLAVTYPVGCRFVFENYGAVPFVPGASFHTNVRHRHALVNESEDDRIAIIILGRYSDRMKEVVMRNYADLPTSSA